ncbi:MULTISPECIES: hypothetical protein [Streptomyces]|uniref:Uncharacterized protein n=1 Tax=Streptomyces chartreusis NRRL 3882 TaxID=1079985 RepID=A0A2N9B8G6_STRCX|nr:hypothetical protein [Streptomyces chartreusis]MYS89387.1 hypothetical protein [Streptomyces sp. SID5464]SOR79636.1 hypothetical protein SCNRRL3882_3097 [Streptomyces chartreusis NRRL 3882]
MLRHEVQPGKLVAGTVFALAGVLYAGDAGGAWETPWFVAVPLVMGGLCLAGAVAIVTGRMRRRRASGRTTDEPGPDMAA